MAISSHPVGAFLVPSARFQNSAIYKGRWIFLAKKFYFFNYQSIKEEKS